MKTTKPTITLNDIEALRLTFLVSGRECDYNRHESVNSFERGTVTDVNAEWGSGRWFAFWIEDCYFPFVYVVQHTSFENAYEEFIDWQVDQLKIEDADLKDYNEENLNYSSKGIPVDTESVQGCECKLLRAECV